MGRERHSVTRKKSDHADAMILVNILRTEAHVHRRLPADSDLAHDVAVLARAAQDAIWRRTKATQELRSLLREYYPGFLEAFAGTVHTNLAKAEARAVLAIAPTPQQGAKLTKPRVIAALRRAGRQRRLDQTATRIRDALRRPQLRQPELVEHAMGRHARAPWTTLDTECVNSDELGDAAIEAFAEIGDDRNRFTDARGLKAFAGAAPVTRVSGRSISITHRRVKNDRLAAVGFVWAFASIPQPGPIKDHYDRRRDPGDPGRDPDTSPKRNHGTVIPEPACRTYRPHADLESAPPDATAPRVRRFS